MKLINKVKSLSVPAWQVGLLVVALTVGGSGSVAYALAITGNDIVDHSITGADIQTDSVPVSALNQPVVKGKARVVSKRVVLDRGWSGNQPTFEEPGFFKVEVMGCAVPTDEEPSDPRFLLTNISSQTITAGSFLAPGESEEFAGDSLTVGIGSGNTSRVAQIHSETYSDDANNQCIYQAQAVTSN